MSTFDDARALLAKVREAGLAVITDDDYFAHGVEAAAAPVFNFKNEITLAIAIVGVEGSMDLSPEGPTLTALRRTAHELSRRLGATLALG